MSTQWCRIASIVALTSSAFAADEAVSANLGKPLNILPSQFWDGTDGPWSTFRIGVGSGSTQQFRVLPASGQSSTLLVLPEVCPSTSTDSGKDCSEQHGGLYMRNESKTWNMRGEYRLDTYLEQRVGTEGDGLYGFDDLSLGWTGDGLPIIKNQSIAGTITSTLPIGSLAINSRPVNFTDYNSPIPSLLQTLRNMSTPIPSLSWSYTAGAYNLSPKVFGSLVLGGFDSTRFEPNGLIFPFGADLSLDLQVAIQRISINGTDGSDLSPSLITYISTLVSDIWLPKNVCDYFAKAYGLSHNATTDEFFINSTMHDFNLSKQPVTRFEIGPDTSGPSILIRLPYWNFFLAAQAVNSGSGKAEQMFRFPIKTALNDSQYILGRAFLQSAYLSTDYERKTFNLSQALYPSTATKQNILPILPPEFSKPSSIPEAGSKGLSTGVIAGVAIGGAAAVLALAAAIFILCRRRRRRSKIERHELEDLKPINPPQELAGNQKKYEMPHGDGLKHEMVGDSESRVELAAGKEQQKPAEIANNEMQIYELPATERKYIEMEGEGHVKELG
ncbi:aspartic peptidase domain-containing protein [Phaeosphaeria sp. MPI-PUGE-AT-0046c]|nr:aspartic peptidase domain-containing protein [Phaeosphaeria sp. MPI-PUGE-AT-0046c]